MSIIHRDGKRFIEVETTAPPPHVDFFFEMMDTLQIPLPTLSNICVQREEVSSPAGIMFMHEAWSRGCLAWQKHTHEEASLERGIDDAVAITLEGHTEQLQYYLWAVWVDMMGFESDEDRDLFLAKKARQIATYAVDMLQADAEGAA